LGEKQICIFNFWWLIYDLNLIIINTIHFLINNYHRHFFKAAILFYILFNVGEMPLIAQESDNDLIILEGRVLSADSLMPVRNAHIISRQNRWGTISSAEGAFKMYAGRNDSVLFTSVGYSPFILVVDDSVIKNSGKHFRVLMKTDTVLINEVIIRGYYDYETFKQIIVNMEPLNLDQFYPDWEDTELLYMDASPKGFTGPVQLLYNWLNGDARLQRQLIRNRRNYNEMMRLLHRESDTIPAIPEHMRE
jgi:hypothetical protein